MNEKISCQLALSLLKSGYKLYSIIDNIKYYFIYSNSYIIITSDNISLSIDEYKFISIYSKNIFFTLDIDEEIDTLKDKEYYSWRK